MFSLKKSKNKLTIIEEKNSEIEILIECESDNPLFENESEFIRQGAQALVDHKNVNNLEEAIIIFATIFRGLKYKGTKQSEDGKTIIILRDTAYKKNLSKKSI